MRKMLVVLAAVLGGCGPLQGLEQVHYVRGLAVSYPVGVIPYKEVEVDLALQGIEMAYWVPALWDGLEARIDDAPNCLADGTLLHDLAHKLRERYVGDADWHHMDWRYFGEASLDAAEYNGALVQRVTAWYGTQFCTTSWRYRPE